MARGLLHNSPVYFLEEATSNIDVESENDIMKAIRKLEWEKTVLLISHWLANVVYASRIDMLDQSGGSESGGRQKILENDGLYRRLWDAQYAQEHYGEEEGTV